MIVGVDVGGTFTDIVAVDPANGRTTTGKVLTNHDDIVAGLIAGLKKVFDTSDIAAGDVHRLVIGTTVATNIVVQRNGARIALLTTEGFEDVLEIGRLKRRKMYDINIDAQTPVFLAPRRLRVGVPERIAADGSVVTPLDEDFVAKAIDELVVEHGIEAVAVCYLFSFENPSHEQRTREIAQERHPQLAISLSSEVNPIHREYERTVVTAFDAYMRPKVEVTMTVMEQRLRNLGIVGEIHVMQSNGGVSTTRNGARRPINLFLSGPAGGSIGGAETARKSEHLNAVTLDIGGTSCDVAVINEGAATVRTEGEIAEFPVRVPMIDITTIGAGGGSLLHVDAGGLLRVGPGSAGSEPGPVCYGRGGSEPTITDASVVLGYLNPHGFADGAFDLDLAAAASALGGLARRLNLSVEEAALGAHRIMNVQMAEQVRLAIAKRGYDLRDFALIAFGGAGPLHAGALISMLGMPACIIPPTPGVQSARGLLSADIKLDVAESFLSALDAVDPAHLAAAFERLVGRGRQQMRDDGIDPESADPRLAADLRYLGQAYEIAVPLRRPAPIDRETLAALAEDFQARYFRMYGHTNTTAVEIVNLRVSVVKTTSAIPDWDGRAPATAPTNGTRNLWFLGRTGPTPCTALHRESLAPNERIVGPAAIEQADTTILVYPEQTATVDPAANLVITGTSTAYAK
jgi:N-methylhydantoinase A/oxoprolinase/acetone carboxylase beta subunit